MAKTNRVVVGVIGCGRIAGHHCRSIRDVEGVELAAVCDLVEEKAAVYGKEFGVAHYTNYNEMLIKHPEINTVAIITPSGMHFEHGCEIIEAYGKNLIVEKPTFLKPSHLTSAYALAEKRGLKIFPVFQNRYNKAVRRVKQAIDTGELGEIQIIAVRVRWCRPQRYYDLSPWRGTFAQDGGALTNQGVHHVDLLRHLGGELSRVNATMRTLGANIEVEDTIVATMHYQNKRVGVLEVTTAARPDDFEASLSFVGSKGLAQLGGIAVNELQVFTPDPLACKAHSEDFSGCVYGFGHKQVYEYVVGDLVRGDNYPVAKEDALSSIRLLHAFYMSDEKGGWMDISEVTESTRLGKPDEKLADLYRTPKV